MKVKVAIAALALGCSVALGGCAAADPAPSSTASQSASANVLTEAVAATEQAGTARITGSLTSTAAGQDMTATISGVQSFDPQAMDITLQLDQGTVRQLLVDGKAYVQVPELGDQWMSLSLGDIAGLNPLSSGSDLSELPPVTADGTGTVEGAAVTYYKTELDLAQALELSGIGEEAGQLLDGATGAATLRVAVDEAGRLVQFAMDTTVNMPDGTSESSKMDLRYYDFGVATDIKAPAPDQVVDGSALQEQLGGQ